MRTYFHLGKFGRFVASAVLLLAALVTLVPLMWAVALSLKPRGEVYTTLFLPKTVRLANYLDTWRSLNMGRLFINNFLIIGGSAIIILVCATLAAYVFAKFRFRGSNTLFQLLLLGIMVPPISTLTGLLLQVKWLGLYDHRVGLMLVYAAFSIPIAVVILRGFFETIPTDFLEAARVDGCSEVRTLWQIVLPLSRPGLASVLVFTSMWNWNDYLRARILMTSANNLTVQIGLTGLGTMYVTQWELMAAGMLMSVAPIFILYVLMKDQFVAGLTAGGLKM
jgi:raffinose/stachyose/melibiose transport system permease protein